MLKNNIIFLTQYWLVHLALHTQEARNTVLILFEKYDNVSTYK